MSDVSVQESLPAAGSPVAEGPEPAVGPRIRLWPPLAILLVYWGAVIGVGLIEIPYFFRFLFGMAAPLLLLIAFSIWWWRIRQLRRGERALGYAAVVGGAFVTGPLTHPSLGLSQTLMQGAPIMISLCILWMAYWLTRPRAFPRGASLLLVVLLWGGLTLVRRDSLDSDLKGTLHWRWTPTAEEKFLAAISEKPALEPNRTSSSSEFSPTLFESPGDWTGFRGADRLGVIRGVTIPTDWKAAPPKLVWKRQVGPAWSSIVIVGDRLFTQEQRGEQEVVICYDAATGEPVWIHEDEARFWESVSGAGPRSTPTFVDGRLFTVGATGVVNALDAATGQRLWAHDLKTEHNAVIPLWGLSGSPLVVDGLVVVFGGGENQENLIAWQVDTGALAWKAEAGTQSYSSPQLITIDGVPQVLMYSDVGITAVDPATGKFLWRGGDPMPGAPRAVQAHLVDSGEILAGVLGGLGVATIKVSHQGSEWKASPGWNSKQVKPEFPDFVFHGDFAYGFDGAIFCCMETKTGNKRWKGGRYGRGQVVLIEDQGLLLVLSETGDAVLVAADPSRHKELGRFPAVAGKTWNTPVVAHGRLYVRNAEEMACYQLENESKGE